MSGMLSLCATPIGNLEDITLRVIRAFQEADCVYAEDTRRTRELLTHLNIKKPVLSCHAHNEAQRAAEIVERVRRGERVAYASDAGLPGISDPGALLLRTARAEKLPYEVLPGASALPMAAVLSGLCDSPFLFLGFLPRKKGERRDLLLPLARQEHAFIIYESPLRIRQTLLDLLELWGDRPAALMRELTKLHEETVRGTLSSLAQQYEAAPPRGECVLAVAGAIKEAPSQEDARSLAARLLAQGLPVKEVALQVSAVAGVSRNEAYVLAMELRQ